MSPSTETLHLIEPIISPDTGSYINRHRRDISQALDIPKLNDILGVADQMYEDPSYQPSSDTLKNLGVEDPLLYKFMTQMQDYLANNDVQTPRSDEERMLLTTLRAIEARKAGTYGIGATWRLVVNGVEYIAMGGNGLFDKADPSLHAEMAAFRLSGDIKRAFMNHPDIKITNALQARTFLGNYLTPEQQHELIIRDVETSSEFFAELDTNLEPCAMCSVAIINEAALGGLRTVHIGSSDSNFAPLGSKGVNTLPINFAQMLQDKLASGILTVRFLQEETDASTFIMRLANDIFLRGRDHLDAMVASGGTSAAGYHAIHTAHTHPSNL